jgi:hypothetical protein
VAAAVTVCDGGKECSTEVVVWVPIRPSRGG